MNCAESEVLIHALIDGELDAGHAREVEAHVATCRGCADKLGAFRAMRAAITAAELKEKAPAHLRRRVEAALTSPPTDAAGAAGRLGAWLTIARASRRNFLGGFALGTAVSAAVAASVVIAVLGAEEDRRCRRDRVGTSALIAGQPSHRCRNERPAYRQALVQRQARPVPAGGRPDSAGLYADRWPSRLC